MDAAQRQLSDQIDHATQRLLGTAREIADSELRQPSLLPGWTRAHVLAHLARGADAMRHLLVGARSGRGPPRLRQRAGVGGRHRAHRGPGHKELAADVAASAMALRTIGRQLPDDAWRFPLRLRDSGPFPAAEVLTRRLVEVELHHGDLGAGYGPADWPAASPPWNSPSRCARCARTGWTGPRPLTGEPPAAGLLRRRQLALEVIDELEMKVQEPAEEAENEQQVLGPGGKRCGSRLGLLEPVEQVADVVANRGDALPRDLSPTRSAIRSRSSSSLLTGVKWTGVLAHALSASRPLSVIVYTVR